MEYAFPRIIFPDDFDERAADEMTMKGWLMAQVELENGSRYPIFFYHLVRLQQDFEYEVRNGSPCLAEPGIVILPEVTVEAAQRAVDYLWKQGFFTDLNRQQ